MRDDISDLLHNFRGLEPLKRLFWQTLNYDRVNQPLPIRDWDAERALFNGDPLLLAEHEEFKIIYVQLAGELLREPQRVIVNRLLQNYPYALFVFSDHTQTRWHFVNVKYERDSAKRRIFRRITIEPGERLRTATERLSMLDLETVSRDLFGISPLAIQQRHDQAFDVEAVTAEFFREYRKVFERVEQHISALDAERRRLFTQKRNAINDRNAGEHRVGDENNDCNAGEHKVRPYDNDINAINETVPANLVFAHNENDEINDHRTIFTQIKSLGEPYPDVAALVAQHGQTLPPGAISGDTLRKVGEFVSSAFMPKTYQSPPRPPPNAKPSQRWRNAA